MPSLEFPNCEPFLTPLKGVNPAPSSPDSGREVPEHSEAATIQSEKPRTGGAMTHPETQPEPDNESESSAPGINRWMPDLVTISPIGRGPRKLPLSAITGSQAPRLEVDTLNLYLRQIGSIPLLNAEEEVALYSRIARGKLAEESLKNAAALEPTRRLDLINEVEAGQAAKETFITSNLRLVVFFAKKMQGQGLDLPDLIQAGNLGLMKAVDKHDGMLGNKFSSYASHWILQGIRRTIANESRTIRLPVHVHEELGRFKRYQNNLPEDIRNGAAAEDEAMRQLDISYPKYYNVARLAFVGAPVQLDTIIENEWYAELKENDAEVEDIDINDRYARHAKGLLSPSETLEQTVFKQQLQTEVRAALDNRLNKTERRVIELLYGIGPILRDPAGRLQYEVAEPMTHTEVGEQLGLSQSEVIHAEADILSRLRELRDVSNSLRDYLTD